MRCATTPTVEPLECRQLMAASPLFTSAMQGKTLVVRGLSDQKNVLVVRLSSDGKNVQVLAGAGATDPAVSYAVGHVKNVHLFGGNLDDVLVLDESAQAFGRGVRIVGRDGNDILLGGASRDTLIGGAGNDIILAGGGGDRVDGGKGNDFIDGGADGDRITAGSGNDIVTGGAGSDRIRADAGDDIVDGNTDSDRIDGDSGNDRIDVGVASAILTQLRTLLGTGTPTYPDASALAALVATPPAVDPATFDADSGADHIDGRAGKDVIETSGSDDHIRGNNGNDIIQDLLQQAQA